MTTEASEGTPGGVSLDISEGVAVITINRPAVRNAIGFATTTELDQAISDVAASDAGVCVVTGAGDRAFVSGGDLKELASVRTHAEAVEMAGNVRSVLDRLAGLPVPVIAALNGHALGGGAETAVAADIRIAADDIQIGFNQVDLGLMPAWGGIERLVGLVGRSRALLSITTGRKYDAPSAREIGLIDVVVPRASFDAEWRALATKLAGLAPGTTRAVKEVVTAATPAVHPASRDRAIDLFATLWAAPEHWAAVEALTAKR